ncbi:MULTISPECIES: YmfL family putative regulatory protein [Yersinia pseudotuberculosis complex]|uniref:DNA-binding protein n=1 Tax=Yersinia similis TaxID=367190 RepID=A0ABM5PZA0_9GAMM|nr:MULTISPECIES: YmfL family putative regulatory protein [Yersinia pseudotuberculosis complex]AHK20350.1 DNA-binding protein [Yersinia similis]AJJ69815.1 putative prophage DNA-binding protein [Yersinia pseudotuberculosis]CFQ72529.1 Uncharacterised protein [Yersinia similis]CNK15528.1 Uncharacterised protein [Yersinia pseudotuberculosis]
MKNQDPKWQAEKQPAWLVAAIKKTITSLPGGYAEAAEWLGVTQNAIFNRLRTDGDQIFPIGWVMVLEKAASNAYVTDAWSKERGGYHVPFVEVDTDNEEIGIKLAELVGRLGDLVNAYRQYIIDGVVSQQEWHDLNDIAYAFRVTLMQFLTLVSRVYCEPERGDAPVCGTGASGALTKRVE